MSKIKLPHASGNSMSIAAPATNPSGDLELKLPATIGTAGQVLQNSSTPGTLEFANAGKILQVVHGTYSTAVTSTDDQNYVDTGLSQAITPLKTGSQFLVQVNQHISVARSARDNGASLKLFQDSTARYTCPEKLQAYLDVDNSITSFNFQRIICFSSKHAHGISAGTSTTYKTQMIPYTSNASGNVIAQRNSMESSITIMEIA